MMIDTKSPAEIASEETLNNLFEAIDSSKCFRLEAGAGAGKTYSLIESLYYIIEKNYSNFYKAGKKVACITYTNIAKNEINERTDNNAIIYAETIHAFSWSLIKSFQNQIIQYIPLLGERWETRLEEYGNFDTCKIVYELGYPGIKDGIISLHHDDVIKIMAFCLENPKFRSIIENKFPIIFIDEYQDTNKVLADSIVKNLIDSDDKIIIGLFGDHWQKIYGSSACGLITSNNGSLFEIGKKANFRSDKNIVDMLNRMRPELPQHEKDSSSKGLIKIFHSNDWVGDRRTGAHWNGDLPSTNAIDSLYKVKNLLHNEGWDISEQNTKILMLTNNLIAEQQGFRGLTSCFSNNEDYLKLNDPYIKYFKEVLEPLCSFFIDKKYGEMFDLIGSRSLILNKQKDKNIWNKDISTLVDLRINGTVGSILDFLQKTKHPRLSPKVEESESFYSKYVDFTDEEKEKLQRKYDKISNIKKIQYNEIIELCHYIDKQTPFSTSHGVKGAQFDNVIIMCGRGWNQYNWNQMLEWFDQGFPDNKKDSFERNRNLFYVGCSRAKKRLSIIFTQELSNSAMKSLKEIFLEENVFSLNTLE